VKRFGLFSLLMLILLSSCATNASQRERDSSALQELGLLYLDKGHYEEAINTFDKALALDGQNSEVLYNKVLALIANKAYQRAIDTAEFGYALFPANLEFLMAKALSEKELGQDNEALHTYERLLNLDPGNAARRALVMEFALEKGFASVAKEQALFLLSVHQEENRAFSVLTTLEGEESWYALAYEFMKEAVEESPESPLIQSR